MVKWVGWGLLMIGLGGCAAPPAGSWWRAMAGPPAAPGVYRFDWRIAGDAAIAPLQVFDDGHRTWLQYPPDQAIPAVFEQVDGGDRLLQPSRQGDFLVLAGVPARVVLRGGLLRAEAWPAGAVAAHAAEPVSMAGFQDAGDTSGGAGASPGVAAPAPTGVVPGPQSSAPATAARLVATAVEPGAAWHAPEAVPVPRALALASSPSPGPVPPPAESAPAGSAPIRSASAGSTSARPASARPMSAGSTSIRSTSAGSTPARPAPIAAAPPPQPVFEATPADGNIRRALHRWARQAGWTFDAEHWAVDVDIPLAGSAVFDGPFLAAVRGLLAATELGDRPVQPCFYANHVLRVVPLAQRCDRSQAAGTAS